MNALRCIVCARVSTDTQAKQGISLSHQLDVGRSKVEELGGTLAGYCIEEGASGVLYESRRELQNALSQIEKKEADALIFFDLSRLARDVEHLLAIERRVTRAGGQIIYCNAHYSKSATGRLHQTIDAAIKDHERSRLREVSMANRRARVESGVQTQRSISPMGYRVVNRDDVVRGEFDSSLLGKYVVNEEEASTVRLIFELYSQGQSLRAIAKKLHELKIPTPKKSRGHGRKTPDGTLIETVKRGEIWLASSIKCILSNTAYYGKASFGKTRNVYDESLIEKGYAHPFKRETVPESEWIYMDCPPLIDKALYDLCQGRMHEAQTLFAGAPQNRCALTGLLRCPQCHRTMAARRTHKPFANLHGDSEKHVAYACKWFTPGRSIAGQCYPKSFWGDDLEPRVAEVIVRAVSRPDLLEGAFHAHYDREDDQYSPQNIVGLKKEMDATAHRLQIALTAQLEARGLGIDSTLYEAQLRELSRRREELRASISSAETYLSHRKASSRAVKGKIEFLQKAVADVEKVLLSPVISGHEKQHFLARIVESIYPINDGRELKIIFRPGVLGENQRWIWDATDWRIEETDKLKTNVNFAH